MERLPTSRPSRPGRRAPSHATHWLLYLLLIAVPIGGWLGVSYYGARDVFGLFSLPALTAENQDTATKVFYYHFLGAHGHRGCWSARTSAARCSTTSSARTAC